MAQNNGRTARRLRVCINVLVLLLFLGQFFIGQLEGFTSWRIGTLLGLLVAIVWYFFELHVRTGFWKLTHQRVDDLDEREIEVVHDALRIAYSIFTIGAILLMGLLLFLHLPSDVLYGSAAILVAWLLYVAHTLPGMVLVWRE